MVSQSVVDSLYFTVLVKSKHSARYTRPVSQTASDQKDAAVTFVSESVSEVTRRGLF